MALKHITRALREGCRLRAFLSGGSLRVIRLERGKRGGKLVGFGEHLHVDEALKLANATLRPIIGRIPKKSVYLTGSRVSEGPLDDWILQGHTFDAWAEAGGTIVAKLLNGFFSDEVPEALLKKAATEGSAEWHHCGGIRLVHSVSCHPNRGRHRYDYSLREIKRCPQHSIYAAAKTGRGKDFDEALKASLEAPQLEVEQKAVA